MTRSHATVRLLIGICAGSLALAAPALAQSSSRLIVSSEGAPATDLPMADYAAFDSFSSAHPEIIAQLSRDPRLMRSHSYLAKHPELGGFLDSHPEVRAAMVRDPGNFLPLTVGGRWIAKHPHAATPRHHHGPKASAAAPAASSGKSDDPAPAGVAAAPPAN